MQRLNETNAQRLRRLRAIAMSNGLCLECRCRRPDAGNRVCAVCIDSRSRRRARRAQRAKTLDDSDGSAFPVPLDAATALRSTHAPVGVA